MGGQIICGQLGELAPRFGRIIRKVFHLTKLTGTKMKITQYTKICNIPGNASNQAIVEWYQFEGVKIVGEQRGRWYFDCKVNNKKYQRVYIDFMAKCLLGKQNETSPWESIVKFDQSEMVQL